MSELRIVAAKDDAYDQRKTLEQENAELCERVENLSAELVRLSRNASALRFATQRTLEEIGAVFINKQMITEIIGSALASDAGKDFVPKSVLRGIYDEFFKMRAEYGDGLFWQKNENGAVVDACQDALEP